MEKPNLYQKILAIMADLSYVQKCEKTVNGQYRFASHDDVTAAVHQMLVKHRVLILPTEEEITQDGNRTGIKMRLTFLDPDNPTDSFSNVWYAYGVDSSDKGPNKAASYAYKYALLKTFALETGEDPDSDVKSVYEPPKCLEFDSQLPEDLTEQERDGINAFLENRAELTKKHVEDVKREALQKFDKFMIAFKKWSKKNE